VIGGELAMIASVSQDIERGIMGLEHGIPGDSPRTILHLTAPLAFSYKRATAKIFGNVVKASHGETTAEIIGSGDASRPSQRFTVKRGPLTHLTAENVSGLESSETVRVNGLRYHRVESALDAEPGERAYELDLDEGGVATIAFTGPLPSGQQNVRATYRVGLGAAGNVRAEQISLATTRPLGVTGVINPLPSAGGAEPDRLEQIRRQAPITAMTMGSAARLVSVADYALFARRFAGIGQAQATKLNTAAHELVFVTVAGVDDAPLSGSAALTSLASAYAEFGDPAYLVEIGTRELLALVLEARVTLAADYVWEAVEPAIRKRLLETFSFDRRALAQSIHLSEVVAAIQSTGGVGFVDVDNFGAVGTEMLEKPAALIAAVQGPKAQVPALKARPGDSRTGEILPAQLAYFVPSLPDLLILNFAQGETDRGRR
jgi:predicted phage baseplate assembly protein